MAQTIEFINNYNFNLKHVSILWMSNEIQDNKSCLYNVISFVTAD